MPFFLLSAAALGLCVVACVTDQRWRVIPNWLTYPGLVGGLLAQAWFSGPSAAGWALAAALIVALVPAFLFARGAMGGGDVKLFAALGVWLGVEGGLALELAALTLLAAFAFFLSAWRGQLWAFFRASWLASRRLLGLSSSRAGAVQVPSSAGSEMSTELPLGGFVLIATAAYLWEQWP